MLSGTQSFCKPLQQPSLHAPTAVSFYLVTGIPMDSVCVCAFHRPLLLPMDWLLLLCLTTWWSPLCMPSCIISSSRRWLASLFSAMLPAVSGTHCCHFGSFFCGPGGKAQWRQLPIDHQPFYSKRTVRGGRSHSADKRRSLTFNHREWRRGGACLRRSEEAGVTAGNGRLASWCCHLLTCVG